MEKKSVSEGLEKVEENELRRLSGRGRWSVNGKG
jgi:hypothetical protein